MTTITHVRRRLAHADARAKLSALGPDEFEGYASLFGVVDGAGDVVAPGAFAKSLRTRPAAKVRLLYQHFAHEPIGVWEVIREDALNGLNIGFRTRRARRDPATGHRILLEIELWEVSVVTFPLLPNSHVTAIGGKSDLARYIRKTAMRISSPLVGEEEKSRGWRRERGAQLR